MFDYIAQFPIEDEQTSMAGLQAQALQETRCLAFNLGYGVVGEPVFGVLDLPVGMHLQCRVRVEELRLGGGHGK